MSPPITETTTLGELHAYRERIAALFTPSVAPFITLMTGIDRRLHAIINVTGFGVFNGEGETIAQALSAAFGELNALLVKLNALRIEQNK